MDAQPTRLLPRRLTLGAAALSLLAASLFSHVANAEVNTTGLAVTDTEVTVGQLHSATGTMAISETGSIQAERLAIEQINAAGGVLGRQIKVIQEDGASDWPTFAEKAKKLLVGDKVARPGDEVGAEAANRLAEHGQLDGLANEARVLDRLERDLAHEGAALRQHLEQPSLGELDERFAHRRAAGAKLLRDPLLGERLPGPKPQGDDGVAQRGVGLDAGRRRALETERRHAVLHVRRIKVPHVRRSRILVCC